MKIRKLSKPRLIEVVRRVINEVGLDPTRLPQKLSDVDPALAKVLSRTGQKDGDKTDDVIKAAHKPEGVAPVGKLMPSQSSMNIEKAMAFVLNMLWSGNKKLNAGGDLGAFISNDRYIMDGHHRWVATAMIDPTMKVGGYLVDFPGEQLVAILNTMTKGLFDVPEGKGATGGFDQFKPEIMKKQLMQYVNSGVWDMKPEDVMAVLEDFTGKEGAEAVDAAVIKMANNLGKVTFKTPPWASGRKDMPVIDDDNVVPAKTALSQGTIDWNEPHAANRRDAKWSGLSSKNWRK